MSKICVFCGESCEGQPRAKDPKGRYYHIACREAAKAAPQQAQPTPQPDLMTDQEASPFHELLDTVATQSAPARACASCGAAMAPGAIVCTACGHGVPGGATTQVVRAPSGGGTSRGAIWPIVVGVISLLIATADLLSALAGAFGGEDGPRIAAVLPVLLALYLLLGGVQLLRRDQRAARTLRVWAWVRVILGVVCGGLAVFGASLLGGEAAEFAGMLAVGLVIVIGIGLIWPVFLLIWLGRATIQNDIESW